MPTIWGGKYFRKSPPKNGLNFRVWFFKLISGKWANFSKIKKPFNFILWIFYARSKQKKWIQKMEDEKSLVYWITEHKNPLVLWRQRQPFIIRLCLFLTFLISIYRCFFFFFCQISENKTYFILWKNKKSL